MQLAQILLSFDRSNNPLGWYNDHGFSLDFTELQHWIAELGIMLAIDVPAVFEESYTIKSGHFATMNCLGIDYLTQIHRIYGKIHLFYGTTGMGVAVWDIINLEEHDVSDEIEIYKKVYGS